MIGMTRLILLALVFHIRYVNKALLAMATNKCGDLEAKFSKAIKKNFALAGKTTLKTVKSKCWT